ncbi:MAG: hypothetical protein H6Q20_2249 [Bacteroidetes bacterium]|nr:hypothetical protein [Bacteroidota bacterium]
MSCFVLNIHYLCGYRNSLLFTIKLFNMRKITLLLSLLVCVLYANAQIVITDDFSYTVGSELKSNGWVGTGSTPSIVNPILVTASSITYSGYPGSGVGAEVSLTTTGEDLNKSFDAITSGFIYVSCLVNFSAVQATGDYFLHIGDAPTGSSFFGRVLAKLVDDKVTLGIQNTSGGSAAAPTYSSTTYDLNTTYLLVIKVNAATGESFLIVNPTMNSTEPSTDWISNLTGTTAVPTAGFKTVNLRQGSASNAPTLKLDGLKVSKSWAALFTTTNTTNPSANSIFAYVSGKDLVITNVDNQSAVEIYSALGSKVKSAVVENSKVDISDLSKGLYIVRSNNLSQKFIIR